MIVFGFLCVPFLAADTHTRTRDAGQFIAFSEFSLSRLGTYRYLGAV